MAAAAEHDPAAARLKVTEIFFSIQGEAVFSGWPTVFVRLTGCPLRCQYCDTAYAFTGGEWRTFAEIEAVEPPSQLLAIWEDDLSAYRRIRDYRRHNVHN